MQVEELPQGRLRLVLEAQEVRYLRWALERATFLDTPPGPQPDIYGFAEELLKRLETL